MKTTKIFLSTLFAFVFGFYIFPSIVQTPIQATQTNSCSSVVVKVHQSSQAHCPLPGYFRIADIACDGVNFFTRYGPNNKPCMTVAEWQNYARQICGCEGQEPTGAPPLCKVINTTDDVFAYSSELECMANCQTRFPGRSCRSVNNGHAGEKLFCVRANLCTYDGISMWESGLPRHPSVFTKVRKNNSCPARDYLDCMDGFTCEETAEGIKITMIDRTQINPDSQGWPWHIGLNCPCQDNIQLPFGGEIFSSAYCEQFNSGWLRTNELQNGESYVCSFVSKTCTKE